MLARVLSAGEDEAGVEVDRLGDDVEATKRALAQRRKGSLAALSGAQGLTYLEVSGLMSVNGRPFTPEWRHAAFWRPGPCQRHC